MAARRIALLSLVALVSALMEGIAAPAASASAAVACSASSPNPWESVTDPPPPAVAEAKQAFLADIHPLIASELSDTWLSQDKEQTYLNIGLRAPTDGDLAGIQEALAKTPEMTLPIRIVSVPYTADELDGFQNKLNEYASENDVPISSSVRPDIGRIEVTLAPSNLQAVADELTDLVPPCLLDVTPGDPVVQADYDRTNMPPVKGGKIEEMHAYGFIAKCTVGFVFELDGPGDQPLRGATAGHCTQGIVRVFDALDDDVGDTVSPNLLRQTGPPAVADGVLWDPNVSRSDIENYVIEDSNTQARVDDGYTAADVSLGDTVCRTGKSSGTDCGNLLDKNFDYNLQFLNFQTGQEVSKQVENGMVAAPNAQEGDSGGPIWVPLVGPPVRCAAAGIASGKQADGDVVFTLTNVIAGHTSSHIWLGG